MLLNRRRVAWDLPRPDNNTLDEWCRVLANTDAIAAFGVLDHLVTVEVKPPSPARIIAEIRGPERRVLPSTDRPLAVITEDEKMRGRELIAGIRASLGRHPSGGAA
jgi:hypothetical protein